MPDKTVYSSIDNLKRGYSITGHGISQPQKSIIELTKYGQVYRIQRGSNKQKRMTVRQNTLFQQPSKAFQL